ncbi:MAG: hypothetical protein PVF85_12275 [Anaerolineales bacterium]
MRRSTLVQLIVSGLMAACIETATPGSPLQATDFPSPTPATPLFAATESHPIYAELNE